MNHGWMNSKPQSVPALAELWRHRIESVYGQPPPALTPRQYGQFKQLRNKLQELTWDVVNGVVGIWPQFTQEARTAAGLPGAPSKPHIGFLLTYASVAVNLLHSLAKESDSPAAAEFVRMVDRKIYEQTRKLAEEVFADDPERLALVEKATTDEELRSLLKLSA